MKLKSIVLVKKNKVRPETMLAMHEAVDGELVMVEDSEFDSFKPILCAVPADDPEVLKAVEGKQHAEREARRRAAKAAKA